MRFIPVSQFCVLQVCVCVRHCAIFPFHWRQQNSIRHRNVSDRWCGNNNLVKCGMISIQMGGVMPFDIHAPQTHRWDFRQIFFRIIIMHWRLYDWQLIDSATASTFSFVSHVSILLEIKHKLIIRMRTAIQPVAVPRYRRCSRVVIDSNWARAWARASSRSAWQSEVRRRLLVFGRLLDWHR